MKILCVSDMIDPLVYNQNARESFPDIDMVLCAGDLPMDYIDFIVTVFNKPTYFIFGNHDLAEFRFYHHVRSEESLSLLSGDYSSEEDATPSHGAIYIGFKTMASTRFVRTDRKSGRRTPLLITGISGSRRYNHGLNQYTDAQMMLKLLLMAPRLIFNRMRYGRFTDIVLTHAAPRRIHDHEDPCHVGFECFNWFLKKFKPAYMVHGHIHLYDQREERSGCYFGTQVINAYAHHIIDFPD